MKKTVKTSYVIERNGTAYLIILERSKNTLAGAPRFKAVITEIYGNFHKNDYDQFEANTYEVKFTGHYIQEGQEAEFCLDEFLKDFE